MTEAEKFLAEKQAALRQGKMGGKTSVPHGEFSPDQIQPPAPATDAAPPWEPSVGKNSTSASRYVAAVLACGVILAVYVMIGAAAGWRNGGGYLIMGLVFGACAGVWRMITKG